jgi:uncharacterized protein YcbX
MRTFTLTPTPEHAIAAPDRRHQLTIHGDHTSDVIHLTDEELAGLRRALDKYTGEQP